MVELVEGEAALERIDRGDVIALTGAATDATFYVDGLTAEQVAANRRIVAISAESCLAAMTNSNRSSPRPSSTVFSRAMSSPPSMRPTTAS